MKFHRLDTLGRRNHKATFERKSTTSVDSFGQETVTWSTVVSGWWAEVITASQKENLRGRTVAEDTVLVLYGDAKAVSSITTTDRCILNGETYGIAACYDQSGCGRDYRIELKRSE